MQSLCSLANVCFTAQDFCSADFDSFLKEIKVALIFENLLMKRLYFFCFLLLASQLNAQEKTGFVESLYSEMATALSHVPAENVYLRTSKEVFETGEDLWFYSRVLNSQTLTVSEQSQILFVELRSVDQQVPVHREMYGLENGFASGHLFLPDSLQAGEYQIIAFTANSLAYANAPLESSRRLMIKKKIIPEVLIQTTFDQEYFQAKEPISGTLRLVTPGGRPIADTRTIISLTRNGKNLERERNRTDSTGRLTFRFEHDQYPESLSVLVRVNDQGYEAVFTQPVPVNPMEKVQLQFMPESGALISGLNNKVAFKAVDQRGMPVAIEKATLFANDQRLLDFNTEHAGMGSFNLFVDPKAKYSVHVTQPAIDSIYVLPPSVEEGVQMFVQRQNEQELRIGVMKTPGFEMDSAYLVLKQHGALSFVMAQAMISEAGQLFKVPLDQLYPGIAEIILYNTERVALASRLVYVGLNRQLKLSVTHDQNNYGVKEEVTLKLKAEDEAGKPVEAALALGLTDELFASPFADKNILSHYFLDSQLKGRIYEPAYYFDQPDATKMRHLDLLLLCQGWRSYEWNQSVLHQQAEKEKLGLLDFVMGQVDRKTLSGKYRKLPELSVQLVSGKGAVQLKTDSLGRFPILTNFLSASAGTDIILKVLDQDRASINFTTAFDQANSLLVSGHLDYGMKEVEVVGRNWNKLPQSQAAAKEVMGVTVVDQKSEYGKFNGRDGHYVGNHSDYVCQYDILNCRNHRFGRRPVPGQIYRMGSRWVVYESPEPENYANTFKAFYQSPKFYQPQYDTKPQEKLIPDFRNTLAWEPLIFTDQNGEATIKLFTSDIRSVFNGWVEGIGGNGQFGAARFKVNVLK